MNPLYILDGPTITRMWLSLLHERYAAWASKGYAGKFQGSNYQRTHAESLRILERAEMQVGMFFKFVIYH